MKMLSTKIFCLQYILFQQVVVNSLLFCFAGKQRPTKAELLTTRKKDGSKLMIISEITSHGPTACEDLATFLLRDDRTVRTLRRENKDDNMFVRKVFDNWLNRDDEDSTDSAVSRTWEELCSCIEDTPDLPGSLLKEIRDHFCF